MESKKNLQILTVINLIFIIACMFGCMYCLVIAKNIFVTIELLVELAASFAALSYFAKGYKKDAAKYYKMFMAFEASTYIIETLVYSFMPSITRSPAGLSALGLILYGNTLLLAFAKDLGKKVSISLAGFNAFAYLALLAGSCVIPWTTEVEKITEITVSATWFSQGGIALIMTIAKYIDKASRNTK